MDEVALETNVPNVVDMSLDEIGLEGMVPEIALMLRSLDKPRANLGSSGPPGRVD